MGRIYDSRKDKEQAKESYRQAVKYGGSSPLIAKEIAEATKKIR